MRACVRILVSVCGILNAAGEPGRKRKEHGEDEAEGGGQGAPKMQRLLDGERYAWCLREGGEGVRGLVGGC